MKLLGVDFETGEDFHKGKEENFITEAGLALWHSKNKLISAQSLLMNAQKPLAQKVIELTHINQNMVNEFGMPEEYVASVLNYYVSMCEVLVAHNIAFDRYYLQALLEKYNYTSHINKPWIDTMTDVPYPKDCYDRGLLAVAAYHRILNYHPHRGLTDTLTMLTVLDHYDIDLVFQNSQSPRVAVIALTSPDQNEVVKQHRFRWYGKDRKDCDPRLLVSWAKECKQWELDSITKDLPFRYDVINLEQK
jgi:DNA polymerase III epsilon subunit-like protein